MYNLRADCLSFLHTFPHPQLNLMPESSQLWDTERKSTINTLMKQLAWSCSFYQMDGLKTVSLTSSSLVRSNSRPLSLNMATWWGPSLNVTYTTYKSFYVFKKTSQCWFNFPECLCDNTQKHLCCSLCKPVYDDIFWPCCEKIFN